MSRTLVLALTIALFAGMAMADTVKPAYTGEFGNPEEPATRPFKSIWRGILALGHHTGNAFVEGNTRTPIIGTAHTFTGIRTGLIELGERSYRGMAGSLPTPYKETGRINEVVERDPFLRNATEFGSTALVLGGLGADSADALKGAALVFTANKVTMHAPLNKEWQDDAAKVTERREARKAKVKEANKDKSRDELRKEAKARYLHKPYKKDTEPPKNLLKLVR